MMKIVTDDNVFVLPVKTNELIAITYQDNKEKLMNCFMSYFTQRKKTLCQIYNDKNEVIDCKEYEFIYVPNDISIKQNIELKNKSLLNGIIEKYISNNFDMFNSIDEIRDGLHDLLTDRGMYSLIKIMNLDLEDNVGLKLENFNLNAMLECFNVMCNWVDDKDFYKMMYNLLINAYKNKKKIIYIDFEINDNDYRWLKNKCDEDTIVIVDNESLFLEYYYCEKLIVLSSNEFLDNLYFDSIDFGLMSYINKYVFKKNIKYQKPEIIKLFKEFNDKETTFLLNFRDNKIS